MQIKHSHLDIVGRPVVVLQKKNVVPEHNLHFQVGVLLYFLWRPDKILFWINLGKYIMHESLIHIYLFFLNNTHPYLLLSSKHIGCLLNVDFIFLPYLIFCLLCCILSMLSLICNYYNRKKSVVLA